MATVASRPSQRLRPEPHPHHRVVHPHDSARLLRFASTGALSAVVQLGLLAVLTRPGDGWNEVVANVVANVIAFVVAAQVTFVLSTWYTWRDRYTERWTPRRLLRHWLAFHCSISGTALLNQGIFLVARLWLPTIIAAALGSSLTAIVNFMIGDRLIFRGAPRGPMPDVSSAGGSRA